MQQFREFCPITIENRAHLWHSGMTWQKWHIQPNTSEYTGLIFSNSELMDIWTWL